MDTKKVTFHSKEVEDKDWFSVVKAEVSYQQYNGKMGEPSQHIYMQGREGVSAVLYDREEDVFLLIEEFRIGATVSDDPWLVGIVTGGLEEGEEPVMGAVREAKEEAGIDVTEMHHLISYFPEPGFSTHQMHAFVGYFDARYVRARINGLDVEGEDIKPILVTREELMANLKAGNIINGTAKIGLSHFLLHGVNAE